MDVDLVDEDYVIQRAKNAFKRDPFTAKAWMITAKTLYPNNFGVQFEAYFIEKNAGHVKEAARCFSDLITTFQEHPELCKEVERVTTALRSESDTNDPEKQFLCEMFKHISSDVQHKLLLFTAEHCYDTMEHCRLLLLLLQRFPTAIPSNGPKLVETLIIAEKHSVDEHLPTNPYRKLLVGELLPLLGDENVTVELKPHKLLFKLLHKSIEYYLYCVGNQTVDNEMKIEDSWKKLFSIIEFIGKQLGWESYLIKFNNNWSKEVYWQKLVAFCQAKRHTEDKQLFFCLSIFFLYCLHEYVTSLTPESPPGQPQTTFVLTEAFIDPNLPSPTSEPKTKKRKSDEFHYPFISTEKPEYKNMHSNFSMCVNCWDLINSKESILSDFARLHSHLKLDAWLTNFAIDYALYKGRYNEARMFIEKITEPSLMLNKYIRIASILYNNKNYAGSFEVILLAVPLLPLNNVGALSSQLIVGGNTRHLHYLPITRLSVLQYLVKILIRCIKQNMIVHYNEMSIGHIFTLVQLDWPQEEDYLPLMIQQIKQSGAFHYPLFQGYLVNVDILEEITYLWTSQGGSVTLDILPHMGQRRIGTRGADKGAKEEIKQTIKRQIARSNEPMDELIINFITLEKTYIKPCL